jgi:hypothetical protein
MGERYYDLGAGGWTQQEQLTGVQQDPQSLDRYAFVEGDPVNFVDLTGLCTPTEVLIGAGGAIAGAVGLRCLEARVRCTQPTTVSRSRRTLIVDSRISRTRAAVLTVMIAIAVADAGLVVFGLLNPTASSE